MHTVRSQRCLYCQFHLQQSPSAHGAIHRLFVMAAQLFKRYYGDWPEKIGLCLGAMYLYGERFYFFQELGEPVPFPIGVGEQELYYTSRTYQRHAIELLDAVFPDTPWLPRVGNCQEQVLCLRGTSIVHMTIRFEADQRGSHAIIWEEERGTLMTEDDDALATAKRQEQREQELSMRASGGEEQKWESMFQSSHGQRVLDHLLTEAHREIAAGEFEVGGFDGPADDSSEESEYYQHLLALLAQRSGQRTEDLDAALTQIRAEIPQGFVPLSKAALTRLALNLMDTPRPGSCSIDTMKQMIRERWRRTDDEEHTTNQSPT